MRPQTRRGGYKNAKQIYRLINGTEIVEHRNACNRCKRNH